VPRFSLFPARRVGPLWIALTAWEMYRRLPPPMRKRLLQEVSKHGPAAARKARETAEKVVARRRPPG
jgi:hypothetical protein